MKKLRILYVLHHFPQISETYIRSEIEALSEDCEIAVIALQEANYPYANHVPFTIADGVSAIEEAIAEFQPDVLHTHWLQQTRILAYLAGYFGNGGNKPSIPFTVRSHSFDVLEEGGRFVEESVPILNSELCLGVLAFPFARPILEQAGVRHDKIHDCFPVVNYKRFYDASPNGDGVMNVGACLPKKQMEDYIRLACTAPDTRFDLYALGYQTPEITRCNADHGNPVHIVAPVEPEDMPGEYKKHRWLVYTADREMSSVGWPMAVAEAQAAGVGVCLPNIRPDLRDYVGECGFLYDSIEEVAEIIRKPFPEEMRQQGFEQAKKSDIAQHKAVLTALWQKVQTSPSACRSFIRSPDDGIAAWGVGSNWLEEKDRLQRTSSDLLNLLPAGCTFLLVDEEVLGRDIAPGRRALPFLERDGQYWGPPGDDDTAVEELDRERSAGAAFMAFAWPAFWWLEHYSGLYQHLRSQFHCVLENERLVVFDLRTGRRSVGSGTSSKVS